MNAYLEHIKNKEIEVIDVTAPSGFVFQFRKPGVFGTLFGIGGLPQAGSSEAVKQWIEDGVLTIGEEQGQLKPAIAKQLDVGMAIVDRVLHLSYKPKLVSGKAHSDDELSTDDVSEEDLTFLYKWVAAGGERSGMLSTFPEGSQQRPLASANRKKRRAAAK